MAGTKRGMPYERTGPFPLDDTFVLSKAEMLTVDDLKMPDVYFAACSDDKKFYMYDKSATPSAETGKFKVLEGGGSGNIVELTKAEYDALTNEQKMNGTVYFIKDAVGGSTLIKSNWGVAKVGVTTVSFSNSQWSDNATVDTTDLGFESNTDYTTFVEPMSGGTVGAWGSTSAHVSSQTKTTFVVGGYAATNVSGTLNIKYIVFAKGYGGGGGGGGKTYTAGNGINITNTEISVDTSVVQEKLESGTSIKTVVGESLLGSGDIPLPVYVGSGWGVAKQGAVSVSSGSPATVSLADTSITSASDYQVVTQSQSSRGSDSWVRKEATSFEIRTSETNTANIYYTVFAKGYGGVPNGGTAGQILAKKSNADGDTEWRDGDLIPRKDSQPIAVGTVDTEYGQKTLWRRTIRVDDVGAVSGVSDIFPDNSMIRLYRVGGFVGLQYNTSTGIGDMIAPIGQIVSPESTDMGLSVASIDYKNNQGVYKSSLRFTKTGNLSGVAATIVIDYTITPR